MSSISRFYSRFSTFTLILFAIAALGVNRYRSQAQIPIFNSLTIVSAATFEETPLAPESIAVAFGSFLSSETASATTVPLPTVLAGAGLKLKDSAGVEHNCGLFFVSPRQINFLVPAGVASGSATLTLTRTGVESGAGAAQIAPVGPGIFSANSSGQGAATGFLLLAPERGEPSYEPLAQFDESSKQFVTRPIDLNRVFIQATRLFLVLYGSGIRGREDLNSVKARIGGLEAPVVFAGAVPGLLGLDQINIPLETPLIRLLIGRGRINIALGITDQRAGVAVSNVIEIEVAGLSGRFSPTITGFEPSRALAGETVTINGDGFFPLPNGNRVRVGGMEAQVIEAAQTQLKIRVPFGAGTGPLSVDLMPGAAVSREPLIIRTSISGFVEDTRRRPIIGVTVRASPIGFIAPAPSITAKTNSEGVFVIPDVPTVDPVAFEVDATTVSATPRLPRFRLTPAVVAGRDNQFPRPITLQIPTGPGLRLTLTPAGFPVEFSIEVAAFAQSFENDWPGAGNLSLDPDATGAASDPSARPPFTPSR